MYILKNEVAENGTHIHSFILYTESVLVGRIRSKVVKMH